MKLSFKKALIILPLLSLITLSGCSFDNGPIGVQTKDYDEFTVTYVKEEMNGDDVLTTFTIKNTGRIYLDYVSIVDGSDSTIEASTSNFDTPFKSAVLQSGQEKNVVFKTSKPFTNKDNLQISGKAYAGGGASSIKGEPHIVHGSDNDYYISGIEIMGSLMMKRPTTLYYGVVIRVEYDGARYYFACDEDHGFSFTTSFVLESDKIGDVEVVGQTSSDKPTSVSEVLTVVGVTALIMLVVPGILGLPVFLAIAIPRTIARKRREAANKE